MNDLKRNGSGCKDPTAERAIQKADSERKRHDSLMYHIFYICQLAGFSVEGRIILKDKKTGKVWR